MDGAVGERDSTTGRERQRHGSRRKVGERLVPERMPAIVRAHPRGLEMRALDDDESAVLGRRVDERNPQLQCRISTALVDHREVLVVADAAAVRAPALDEEVVEDGAEALEGAIQERADGRRNLRLHVPTERFVGVSPELVETHVARPRVADQVGLHVSGEAQ